MMVVHAVMPTDSATSPFDRYVMTLEEVPPGQQPTSITPTASSVGSWKTRHSTQAISGMMMNWDRMPVITAFGLVNTTLKSPSLSVMPMPNMTMPSSGLTQRVGSAACTGAGATKAMMATASAMMAIHLPAKSLIFSRTFMMNLSNVRALLGKRTLRRRHPHMRRLTGEQGTEVCSRCLVENARIDREHTRSVRRSRGARPALCPLPQKRK